MDPLRNPFAPGAGARPPELAGRAEILAAADTALQRILLGRSAQSQMLLGLRGVGKTVLLNEILNLAQKHDYLTSSIEVPEDRTLADLLYPQMLQVLRKLSALTAAKALAIVGLRGLRSFASAFKLKLGDVEIGVEPAPGVADSGDLENDLPEIFEAIGRAAQAGGKAWALFLDEVQYLSDAELAALIVAMHRMAQKNLPVLVFGGGLPQIARLSGEAKSYAERLFIFPEVGSLDAAAARAAIVKPLHEEGADITPEALAQIVRETKGYPFFLQEWGHHAWEMAPQSPITLADVEAAGARTLQRLDQGFFRVRFDRLTKAEVEFVRAMAALGPGPYPFSAIAETMGKSPKSLGPRRASLIRKGMIYAPVYGMVDFTVPLFHDFLRRRAMAATI